MKVLKIIAKVLMYTLIVILLLAVSLFVFYHLFGKMSHSKPSRTPEAVVSSGDPVLDSLRKGMEYLKVYQEKSGHFSKGILDPKPAFTALVVEAALAPPQNLKPEDNPWLQNAIDAILATQQPDGGFYTPRIGIGNYCTSVSIMALTKVDGDKYKAQIQRGIDYIFGVQRKNTGNESDEGGFGYFSGSRPDLSNTVMSIEAMKEAGIPADHPSMIAAIQFVSRCQNNSETNKLEWAQNDGGFVYKPSPPKEGSREAARADGFKSYGLMTYAGLLSMIYTEVPNDDPRVKAAMRWISENYTVHDSAGNGDAGLYYYFRMMAKALASGEILHVQTASGDRFWPSELANKVISLQRPDGSWANTNARWMEEDPILVTTYCVRTLSYCHQMMAKPKK